jgi:hypothetical protein
MKISVVLPQNRIRPGQLSVFDDDGSLVFGPVACLGKADNGAAKAHGNPTRDPTQRFGDTPTGSYAAVMLVVHDAGETNVHTYGAHPSILLDPVSGQALTAKQQGRTGIMIHGGAPSPTGGLRPTNGCVRLSEADQGSLIALVQPVALRTVSVVITEAT